MLLRWVQFLLLGVMATGCVSRHNTVVKYPRAFQFETDSFAYANELVMAYQFDPETGNSTMTRRVPKPEYTLHCFVVARTAKQFFQFARFDPSLPKADDATYRKLIRKVATSDLRFEGKDSRRVVIPGYANLREFSEDKEALLKENCGSYIQSYIQRGNWRAVLPFNRKNQELSATHLKRAIDNNDPPVVHLVRFPSLAINHAVVLFGYEEKETEIQFKVYDPNDPKLPALLIYDNASRTFLFPSNHYFVGGRVDVYEIYSSWYY